MDIMRKLLPVETRAVSTDDDRRVITFVASTETPDRVGDVLKASGWVLDRFKRNPVVQWAHQYDQPPIGRATNIRVDRKARQLVMEVEFPDAETYEFADTIYKLYKGGYLHAVSVGYIPLNWEGKTGEKSVPNFRNNVFTKMELLELSAIPVPANPEALVSARSAGVVTDAELIVLKALSVEITEGDGGSIDTESTDPVTKPETTEKYHRIPVESGHDGHRIRTITVSSSQGIKALYCGEHKLIITYLFAKEKWSMAEAQEWVEEHKGKMVLAEVTTSGDPDSEVVITESTSVSAHRYSQTELQDTIDELKVMVESAGLNSESKTLAWRLVSEIVSRSTGNDIPDAIALKFGAVLEKRIKDNLLGLKLWLDEALGGEPSTAPDGEGIEIEHGNGHRNDEDIDVDTIKALVRSAVRSELDYAKGKLPRRRL